LHAHIIPNIVNISLKRVEIIFCPGSKNSTNGKTARYNRIVNELCHFYKVSLIKTGLMFHKYHLLNQLQVFMKYKRTWFFINISLIIYQYIGKKFYWTFSGTNQSPLNHDLLLPNKNLILIETDINTVSLNIRHDLTNC
jgi:hypothetical protein